ncbi:MAG: dihydrofolate reductase [Lachnospiraceae bacterium]|nr:dihydrofolate reductase [Lachnospiraceae bacterium]
MIGIIVARSKNNVIGKDGKIPWRIKGEQKQFKELTTGNVVIMGRRSYEEIGHPLPNRLNIIVSKTCKFEGDNLVTATSLEDAITKAKEIKGGDANIYISGGYGLFKEGLEYADRLYITEVDIEIEDGDTFFPEFDKNDYDVIVGETGGDDICFTRVTYIKNKIL